MHNYDKDRFHLRQRSKQPAVRPETAKTVDAASIWTDLKMVKADEVADADAPVKCRKYAKKIFN